MVVESAPDSPLDAKRAKFRRLARQEPRQRWRITLRDLLFPKTSLELREITTGILALQQPRPLPLSDGQEQPAGQSQQPKEKASLWFSADWFDVLSLFFIFVNTITLAMADPLNPNSAFMRATEITDAFFAGWFVVELVLRVVCFGPIYFRVDPWNVVDALIVIVSAISTFLQFVNISSFSLVSLRSVRVLRPLRSIRAIAAARLFVVSAWSAMTSLRDVALAYAAFLVIFGVGGTELYSAALRSRCVSEDWYNLTIANPYELRYSLSLPDFVKAQRFDQIRSGARWQQLATQAANWTCYALLFATSVPTPAPTTTPVPLGNASTLRPLAPNPPASTPALWCANFTVDRDVVYAPLTFAQTTELAALGNRRNFAAGTAGGGISFEEQERWATQTCDVNPGIVLRGFRCPFGYTCALVENPFNGRLSFDNLASSVLCLFISVTLEVWFTLMYLCMDAMDPTAVLFFVTVVVIGAFFLVNLSTVLITVEFERSCAKELRRLGHTALQSLYDTFVNWYASVVQTGATHLGHAMDAVANTNVFMASHRTRVRKVAFRVVQSQLFLAIAHLVILVNVALMAAEFYQMPSMMEEAFRWLSLIFTMWYTVELGLRFVAYDPVVFFRGLLNTVDIVVVVASWIDFAIHQRFTFSLIKALRALRLLSTFKSSPATYFWVRVMVKSLRNSLALAMMILCAVFVFASLGMGLFGGFFCDLVPVSDITGDVGGGDGLRIDPAPNCLRRPRRHYDSIGAAIMTSFIVMTGDNWQDVLFFGMRARGNAFALYYVVYFSLSNYVMLNLLIGILLSVKATEAEHDRLKQIQLEEARQQHAAEVARRIADGIEEDEEEEELLPIENGMSSALFAATANSQGALSALVPPVPTAAVNRNRKGGILFVPTLFDDVINTVGRRVVGDDLGRDRNEVVADLPDWTPVQLKLQAILQHRVMQLVIGGLVMLSSLVLALEEPASPPDKPKQIILDSLDLILTVSYSIEAVVSIIAYGFIRKRWCYLRNPSNAFDFALVLASVIGEVLQRVGSVNRNFVVALRPLRVFRAMRPLRFVQRAAGLRVVVRTLFKSIGPLRNLLLVIFVVFTMWGIMGVQLFKGSFYSCTNSTFVTRSNCTTAGHAWVNAPLHFDNIGAAYLALFTAATLDGWSDIMFWTIDAVGPDRAPEVNHSLFNSMYLVSFVVVCGIFVVNLFISVIIDSYTAELQTTQGHSRWLTPSQNAWIGSHNALVLHVPVRDYDNYPRSSWYANRKMQVRNAFRIIVRHPMFDVFVYCSIVVNFLTLAADTYPTSRVMGTFLKVSNYFFAGVFVIEIGMKLVADRTHVFMRSLWNRVDFVVVLLSVISLVFESVFESASFAAFFRVVRVTRLMRIVRKWRRLQAVLKRFVFALYSLHNVGAVVILVYFIFGVTGMKLFGRVQRGPALTEHANFETIANAMLLMLRTTTGGDWSQIMNACAASPAGCGQLDECGVDYAAQIYFVLLLIIGMFILINLFVAVIFEAFSSVLAASLSDALSETDSSQFFRLWLHFDPERTYRMESRFLVTLLRSIPAECRLSMGNLPVRRRLQHELAFVNSLCLLETDGLVELQDLIYALCRRAFREELPDSRRRALIAKSNQHFRRTHRDRYKPDVPARDVTLRFAAMIIEAYWLRYKEAKVRSLAVLQRRGTVYAMNAGSLASRSFAVMSDGERPRGRLRALSSSSRFLDDDPASYQMESSPPALLEARRGTAGLTSFSLSSPSLNSPMSAASFAAQPVPTIPLPPILIQHQRQQQLLQQQRQQQRQQHGPQLRNADTFSNGSQRRVATSHSSSSASLRRSGNGVAAPSRSRNVDLDVELL